MKRWIRHATAWLADARERTFLAGLIALVGLGTVLRSLELSSGTLYRDDAWVALGSRVPLSMAWRMTGTAPGFTLIERTLFQWVGHTTWLVQLPTLVVSIVGMAALAALLRWWGLSRLATLFGVALLALSRIDISYATHVKPYAHDVLASIVVLAAAQWWRRGGSAWWFAGLSALCLITSFTVFPLVLGVAVVLLVQAQRTERLRSLILPGLCGAAPTVLVAFFIRDGISPRLDSSWRASYVDYHSLQTVVSSLWKITASLLWGLGNTTPGIHVPLFGRVFQVMMLVLLVAAFRRRAQATLAIAALVAAYASAALHMAPLGTGRTDAYLHPALIILLAIGAEEFVRLLRSRSALLARVSVAALALAMTLTGVDRSLHRQPYPGGDLLPVISEAAKVLNQYGAVLVEGTARWPWALYGANDLSIRFSHEYNTGFAPLTRDKNIVLMPGTIIEGGYDPTGAIAKLNRAPIVLYVQTSDWPAMGHPLARAAHAGCYSMAPTQPRQTPGYETQLWIYGCSK